jgi:hypothetical protein
MPRIESEQKALLTNLCLRTVARVVLSSVIISGATATAPAHAAPPAPQEPVPVNVQNTPLPVEIQNQPVSVIPAERAGLVVQGTVAAAQSGSWTVNLSAGTTVNLPARKLFRGRVLTSQGLTNQTSDLLVIDRVSGTAPNNYFELGTISTAGYGDRIYIAGVESTAPGFTIWVFNFMTQLYVKPGEALSLGTYGNDVQSLYLSGHYEPLAQP